LGVIRGSHTGTLYDQYDANGEWVGCLSDNDVTKLKQDDIVYLPGPAGSLTIHNCRSIHGSQINLSAQPRPLLLNVYSASDAMPYTFNPLASRYAGNIVRGKAARWARHDAGPCLIPPDWSGGYTSIFSLQQEEGVAPN
jgi:ectoine hydroxylase